MAPTSLEVPPAGNPSVFVGDTKSLDEAVEMVAATETVIGIDIETTSLNPHTGRLRLVQVSDGDRTFVVDAFKVDPRPLLEAVSDKDWVAHNAAFELAWAKHLFDLEPTIVRDTMLMSQVLGAGSEHRHGLEDVLNRELGMVIDKEHQLSDWTIETLSREQISYAATDAAVLPALYRRLEERLGEER